MHLEADILQGKIKSRSKLIKEAKEELGETKKGKVLRKAIQDKKNGKSFKHIIGKNGHQLV